MVSHQEAQVDRRPKPDLERSQRRLGQAHKAIHRTRVAPSMPQPQPTIILSCQSHPPHRTHPTNRHPDRSAAEWRDPRISSLLVSSFVIPVGNQLRLPHRPLLAPSSASPRTHNHIRLLRAAQNLRIISHGAPTLRELSRGGFSLSYILGKQGHTETHFSDRLGRQQ